MGRTYVVSDIHGCFDELMCALDAARFNPSAGDVLYILGDIIDRGLSTPDAIRWLINQSPENVKFLVGNHESMMMEAIRGNWEDMHITGFFDNTWVLNGGYETAEAMYSELTSDERRRFFELVGNAPILQRVTVNGNDFLLTHAGLTPYEWMMQSDDDDTPEDVTVSQWLKHQDRDTMLWVRGEWLSDIMPLPFYVVTGHTIFPGVVDRIRNNFGDKPTRYDLHGNEHCIDAKNHNSPLKMIGNEARILTWNGRIAIDGGCVRLGRLLLLCLDDGMAYYVPLQERGVTDILEKVLSVPAEDWSDVVTGKAWEGKPNAAQVEKARCVLGSICNEYPMIISKYLSDEAIGLLVNSRGDVDVEAADSSDPFAVTTEKIIFSEPDVENCPLLLDDDTNTVDAILYDGDQVLRSS